PAFGTRLKTDYLQAYTNRPAVSSRQYVPDLRTERYRRLVRHGRKAKAHYLALFEVVAAFFADSNLRTTCGDIQEPAPRLLTAWSGVLFRAIGLSRGAAAIIHGHIHFQRFRDLVAEVA